MSVSVAPVAATMSAEWDDFVRASSGWTPYHLYAWRHILEDVHHHECFYLGARDAAGAIRGVLPLVRVRSRVFGHFLVSMPFLNYGGPFGEEEAVRALAEYAVNLADDDDADLLELRAGGELPLNLDPSHRKITVVLDLPDDDPEPLWKGLKAKVRSQVRRPIKEGVSVRFGREQLDPFYQVFSRHMRDLGTPVQPRKLFAKASEHFGETMWVGCAYLGDSPIAAGCGFQANDRFELVWASALREYNRIAPNMLLYWRFVERCVEEGVSLFDFGRCSPGGGTHRFKQQWGGRDERLWWYQHGPSTGRGTPSPDSGPFSLGPKLWRRLPLTIANALGPRIVKHIP